MRLGVLFRAGERVMRQNKHRQGGSQTNSKMKVIIWEPYEAAQRVRTPRDRTLSQAAGSESCVVCREAGA
jgi:hypothetical protein